MSVMYIKHTVFTWLNAAATITIVVKLDAATIQGRLLFEGGVYYTEASSVRLLFNNYNSIVKEHVNLTFTR